MRDEMLSAAKAELVILMKRRGEITIKEASTDLELATSTIRQHLSRLETNGFVDRRLNRTGVGRPSQLYYLTKKAEAFFENREPTLLVHLIRKMIESGEEQKLESFFSSFSKEQLRVWERKTAYLEDDQELQELQRLLEEWGYVPECRYEDGKLVVELFHCPYPNVAKLVDFQCECEMRLLEHLTNTKLLRECAITDGCDSCRFRETDAD